ncbi:hypothetical protein GCM10027051_31140 [Niabella terrae]
MNKPTHAKPGLYAMYYEMLKDIAKLYGYNLLIHGSLHRDLDLVAVPWVDDPKDELLMIAEFDEYLSGKKYVDEMGNPDRNAYDYSVLPGGRRSYVINLNRGDKNGEWVRFRDEQYYLDISVIPYAQLGKNN